MEKAKANMRLGNQRLLKLAQHGRTGTWGHEIFRFDRLNHYTDDSMCYNKCGTVGCFLGELPIAFPENFVFINNVVNLKSDDSDYSFMDDVMGFFCITEREIWHLFYPNHQLESWGKRLRVDCTKEEVSENIEKFVEMREKKLGTPNARFWTYWREGFVKLTLKPGDNLGLHCGGPTDEGYYSHYEEYYHDDDKVTCVIDTDASDCDGRISSCRSFSCPLNELKGYYDEQNCIYRPNWVKERSSQRDYEAEKAGY